MSLIFVLIFVIVMVLLLLIRQLKRSRKPIVPPVNSRIYVNAKDWNTTVGPFGMPHKRLEIGDRLVIFGGYNQFDEYLNGRDYYIGEIVKMIFGETESKSVVVLKMSELIESEDYSGQYFILSPRWSNQDWQTYCAVHIELNNTIPEDYFNSIGNNGKHIECAASYEFEDRYFKIRGIQNTTLPNIS